MSFTVGLLGQNMCLLGMRYCCVILSDDTAIIQCDNDVVSAKEAGLLKVHSGAGRSV